MLLWSSIEKFKILFVHNLLPPEKMAITIYSTFIPHGSPLEVSLHEQVRDELYDMIINRKQMYNPSLFNDVQAELLNKFKTEDLQDFLGSNICINGFSSSFIRYIPHLNFKTIIDNSNTRKYLQTYINSNFPSYIVILNFLCDVNEFNHTIIIVFINIY